MSEKAEPVAALLQNGEEEQLCCPLQDYCSHDPFTAWYVPLQVFGSLGSASMLRRGQTACWQR